MATRWRPLPPLLLALLGFAEAHADVVILSSGERVAGPILRRAEGVLIVRTLGGDREIPADDVLLLRDERACARDLDRLARRTRPDDLRGRGLLVRQAIRLGLFERALDLADETLELAQAERASAFWIDDLSALPLADLPARPPSTPLEVRRLLSVARRGGAGRVRLVRERLERADASARPREELRRALRDPSPSVRRIAVEVLAAPRFEGTLPEIVERALTDRDPLVREAAQRAAAQRGGDRFLAVVARTLENADPSLRAAALETAARLQNPRLLGALVRHLRRAVGTGKVRAHFQAVTQTSYVRDFDVEVAQAAVIAAPRVGVVQHGAVLDVGVAGVSERSVGPAEVSATTRALAAIAGVDLGSDWRRWDAWLREQERRLDDS